MGNSWTYGIFGHCNFFFFCTYHLFESRFTGNSDLAPTNILGSETPLWGKILGLNYSFDFDFDNIFPRATGNQTFSYLTLAWPKAVRSLYSVADSYF